MEGTVVILAGGRGQRMGGVNKALLPLGSEAFLERQLRVASQWTDEIIVVSNDTDLNSYIRQLKSYIRIIPDLYKGEGPLAGLHAGLAAATRSNVWLLGCDQPFIDPRAANLLLDYMEQGTYQASLPILEGRRQPLHALYRKETAETALSLLEKGERRLLALLNHISWCGIEEKQFTEQGISLKFVHDVDTPEQYDRASLLFTEEQ